MTIEEIIRAAYITALAIVPLLVGFVASWVVYKGHIKDLRGHVRDLKDTILSLLTKNDGD